MKVSRLVWNEIVHRKIGFCLAVIAVGVAVAACVCVLTMARAQQLHTSAQVAALDNEIRKITKNMGFNIMVFPRALNLADFHADNFGQVTMPEEFVQRLADSPDVVTVNHLRPALIRKVQWPEQNRQVLLMGVRGIVPFKHRDNKKPLSQPIQPGTLEVGSVLANELQLSQDDQVAFQGESFRIAKVHPPQGNKDDITVWMDLPKAQELLDLNGRINMIQALECNCASIDRLAEIDKELSGLLNNEVKVVEMSSIAIARAKSRNEVEAAGKSSAQRMERFALQLLPLAIVGAGMIVGLLALANVRERRGEIGILRAIGLRSRQVLAMFVGKALIVGLLGGTLGFAAGFGLAHLADRGMEHAVAARIAAADLFQPAILLAVVVLTPLFAILASWLPALMAATQDPAVVLREE